MKKEDFSLNQARTKALVAALAVLVFTFISVTAWQGAQAINSLDYTAIVKTKPFPVIKTEIDKSFDIKRVTLFYRLKGESNWRVKRMEKVGGSLFSGMMSQRQRADVYQATPEEGLKIDDELQYYIQIISQNNTVTTRPNGAPNSYFNLIEHLITIK